MSSAADSSPVVVLDEVSVIFPGTNPVHALTDISLEVRPQELIAVIGPSGSGKSTLLAVLGGLRSPTSGHLLVGGRRRIDGSKELDLYRRSTVGFVFQTFCLLSPLTATENVMMGELYRKIPVSERRARAIAALDSVGLAKRRDHRVGLLSGGEQQRVAVARALSKTPSLLLADEPTGNLDSSSGQEVLEHFATARQQGASVVVATHDRHIAHRATRIVELIDGRMHSGNP